MVRTLQSPAHGFRGDTSTATDQPRGLTIAISREAGARGGSIARRVAKLLGWQVFNQEQLGFLAQDENARNDLFREVSPTNLAWAENRLQEILRDRRAAVRPDFVALIRLVLVLAARGDVLIVGRGAGFLLPTETTLNVRIIAPREERIAYLAQWLRLPPEAAKAEMDKRDRVRSELHAELADRDSNDLSQYDILLNSGRLDEATCAELIAQAIRAKQLPEPADSELDSAG